MASMDNSGCTISTWGIARMALMSSSVRPWEDITVRSDRLSRSKSRSPASIISGLAARIPAKKAHPNADMANIDRNRGVFFFTSRIRL